MWVRVPPRVFSEVSFTQLKVDTMNETLNKPDSVTISRKRWLRGEKESCLLREKDQKMCCLGFLLKAAGAKDKDIETLILPSDVYHVNGVKADFCLKKLPRQCLPLNNVKDDFFLVKGYGYEIGDEAGEEAIDNDVWVYDIAWFNDDQCIDDHEREKAIRDILKSQGISVKFVD